MLTLNVAHFMQKPSYPYRQLKPTRYFFISTGLQDIEKVVDFMPSPFIGVLNLAFGDLSEDGTISDAVQSNNGDILKVMSTVVNIVKHFTACYPHYRISFMGSTSERTLLYARILKMYYQEFSKDFIIKGVTKETEEEVDFDCENPYLYERFIIQKIL